MLARDHALSGALVFTAVAPVLHVSGPALLPGAVFTAGAATAPDIDERGSTISRTLGFFTEAVSWLVHKISGGHRKGTHSILGVAVFTFAAWLAVTHAGSLTGKIVLGVILGLILRPAARLARSPNIRATPKLIRIWRLAVSTMWSMSGSACRQLPRKSPIRSRWAKPYSSRLTSPGLWSRATPRCSP